MVLLETCTYISLVCSNWSVLGHPERQHVGFIWKIIGKFQNLEPCYSMCIHIFVDVWIIMQTTDMDTPNIWSVFLKEDTPHSWELRRELHLPQSPSADKHDPLSDNMSDIYTTKEWPLTASSPLARWEITFIWHTSVLPPYSREWYCVSQRSQSEVIIYSFPSSCHL